MEYMYTLDYPSIAKKIKFARKAARMTQEQLAEKINISTNAVAKLENNFMTPGLQTLVNIVNILGMDMDYLLQREGAPSEIETDFDAFLSGLIRGLSQRDKDFIIHVINGLKIYNASERG